jgi:peptide/nickel transport system permease protein
VNRWTASWRGLPRRLRVGATLFAGLTLLTLVGPLLTANPNEILDPRALALLRPSSSRWLVNRPDGSWLAAEALEQTSGGLKVTRGGTTELIANDRLGAIERRHFWLGTDTVGRDVLARLLAGGRISLAIGALALALTLVIGIGLGALAGWRGGWVDTLLMRLVDAFLAIPTLFLMLVLAALLRPSLVVLAVMLAGASWMGVARLVRAQVLSLKEREFILAARAIGASGWRIVFRHILPNAVTPVAQDAALRLGDLILAEAALSFLGLGVQPPTPSWGAMVSESQEALHAAWWLVLLPSLLVAFTVIAAALVADGLQQLSRPATHRG